MIHLYLKIILNERQVEMEINKEMMNINEVTRLIEWLEAKGISDDDIKDCIRFINDKVPTIKEVSAIPQK